MSPSNAAVCAASSVAVELRGVLNGRGELQAAVARALGIDPRFTQGAEIDEAPLGEVDEVELEKERAQKELAEAQRPDTAPADDAELDRIIREIIEEDQGASIQLLDHHASPDVILAAEKEQVKTVKVRVAADTGAVANVIGKKQLPEGIEIAPNITDEHFSGAGGDRIKRHGTCKTKLVDNAGREIGCGWHVADVTRALHSISEVAGPGGHPTGHHDVLFNNKKGVVVPPGIVEKILKHVKPGTQYDRTGGLHIAEMELSGFTRQGPCR